MRLRRLDLIRYGRFTDKTVDLPAGKADFHIFFGPNEAGKSTALSAVEDLLFGIPARSPYGFLHGAPAMRIGALLENGQSSLEIVRRKGNKDTLLAPDGSIPVGGESILQPFLAGADRLFFERMFSLDHKRLESGGRDILEAKDDAGRTLFSAGAGIEGLTRRLNELANEADTLWGPRRAKSRKFYAAYDKLKEAERELREQTFTAGAWRDLKRSLETAEEVHAKVNADFEQADAERNRLQRIRLVHGNVRRKQEIDSEIEALGTAAALPEDAAAVLETAQRKGSEAAARGAALAQRLSGARAELAELTFDETLIRRADDIEQLHERRIEIRREKADLPKRETELNLAEEELRGLAAQLGWTDADIAALTARVPPRPRVAAARALLNRKGEADTAFASVAKSLREKEAELKRCQALDADTGEPADVSRLAAVIRAVRGQGDIAGRRRAAQQRVNDARELASRRLAALHPGAANEEDLTRMHPPARAQVQNHRDRVQECERDLREARRQSVAARQELDRELAERQRLADKEQVVTAEELAQARNRRDALWGLVKLKHVQGAPVTEEALRGVEEDLQDGQDPVGPFELAQSRADALTDRRFDRAEAAARLAEIDQKIGRLGLHLEQAEHNEAKLVEERERLAAKWASLWSETPVEPAEPEAMPAWLEARDDALEAFAERTQAEHGLEAVRAEERDAVERLLAELAALGADCAAWETAALPDVLEKADDEQSRRENEALRKEQLRKAVVDAENDVARAQQELDSAREARSSWRNEWAAAVSGLGLSAGAAPEAIETQVEIIEQMRVQAGRIHSLQHDRIDKIKHDIADFEKTVAELTQSAAADLEGQPAEEAALAIEQRLAEAERLQGLSKAKREEVEKLAAQIDELEQKRREWDDSVAHLKEAAGVETHEALREAIGRSDRRRALENDLQATIEQLQQDGGGRTADELEKECAGVDIDQVAARESALQTELTDLRRRLSEAAGERSRARQASDAVDGGDAAARAAADKQEALAEMREAAERYVRVRTAAMLLDWAIDRFRREKQAPLLKRAGELFALITGDSFAGLQVDYDERDRPHLIGLRPDEKAVPVSGMSDGTTDQLYLALRVASIEAYLKPTNALPFAADDLFINFDDRRAAAGLKLLERLAAKTQVLFFTHHRHLVEIARDALDPSVRIIDLAAES